MLTCSWKIFNLSFKSRRISSEWKFCSICTDAFHVALRFLCKLRLHICATSLKQPLLVEVHPSLLKRVGTESPVRLLRGTALTEHPDEGRGLKNDERENISDRFKSLTGECGSDRQAMLLRETFPAGLVSVFTAQTTCHRWQSDGALKAVWSQCYWEN